MSYNQDPALDASMRDLNLQDPEHRGRRGMMEEPLASEGGAYRDAPVGYESLPSVDPLATRQKPELNEFNEPTLATDNLSPPPVLVAAETATTGTHSVHQPGELFAYTQPSSVNPLAPELIEGKPTEVVDTATNRTLHPGAETATGSHGDQVNRKPSILHAAVKKTVGSLEAGLGKLARNPGLQARGAEDQHLAEQERAAARALKATKGNKKNKHDDDTSVSPAPAVSPVAGETGLARSEDELAYEPGLEASSSVPETSFATQEPLGTQESLDAQDPLLAESAPVVPSMENLPETTTSPVTSTEDDLALGGHAGNRHLHNAMARDSFPMSTERMTPPISRDDQVNIAMPGSAADPLFDQNTLGQDRPLSQDRYLSESTPLLSRDSPMPFTAGQEQPDLLRQPVADETQFYNQGITSNTASSGQPSDFDLGLKPLESERPGIALGSFDSAAPTTHSKHSSHLPRRHLSEGVEPIDVVPTAPWNADSNRDLAQNDELRDIDDRHERELFRDDDLNKADVDMDEPIDRIPIASWNAPTNLGEESRSDNLDIGKNTQSTRRSESNAEQFGTPPEDSFLSRRQDADDEEFSRPQASDAAYEEEEGLPATRDMSYSEDVPEQGRPFDSSEQLEGADEFTGFSGEAPERERGVEEQPESVPETVTSMPPNPRDIGQDGKGMPMPSTQPAESMELNEKLRNLHRLVDSVQTAMLCTRRPDGLLVSRAMQVLHHNPEHADLVFATNNQTHKMDDIIADPHVNVSFFKESTKEWVSISGIAHEITDRERVREFWSEQIQVWLGDLQDGVHDGGPEDPRISLILVEARTVAYSKQGMSMEWDHDKKKSQEKVQQQRSLDLSETKQVRDSQLTRDLEGVELSEE